MPTYEYKCPKCGTEFEEFQKMNAKSAAKCPKCGAKAERQLSGGGGFVFKGSGFYTTDYKRAGEKKPSEGPDKPSGEKSSEKSGESGKSSEPSKPAKQKKDE